MATTLGKRTNPGFKERKIRTAFVFGQNGENMIVVFENDEVFGLGKNQNGCLGTCGIEELTAFTRIEELCGKKIERFEYGSFENKFSIFAISAIGNLFSWGENSYGQLGIGTERYIRVPTQMRATLLDWNVVRVACGRYHTLALTIERQVFAFGQNWYSQIGVGPTRCSDTVTYPQKICGLLQGEVVTSIACQALSSFALLASGQILAWGSNMNGRLGVPFSSQAETPSTPRKVEGLNKIPISRVVCGDHFTLALSKEGAIYAWGGNMYGQLGNGLEFVRTPTIISSEMGARVKDIDVSRNENHTCAAITENDQVYVWGSHKGKIIKKPSLTSFSSLDEVFSDASSSAVSCQLKGMMKEDAREDSIIKFIQKGFDNPETADVTFIVEERKIHVQKFVLMMKSVVFKKLFLGNWKDSCAKELNIERYSYDSFHAFLKFFYTDEVDCAPKLAPEIFAAAHFYRVSGLMEECEEIMKSNLSVKNAAAIYEKATLCGAKDLEKFCFNYCKMNLVAAVHSFESDECKKEAIMDVYRRAANQDSNGKNNSLA